MEEVNPNLEGVKPHFDVVSVDIAQVSAKSN
jgi:hypothetical protein